MSNTSNPGSSIHCLSTLKDSRITYKGNIKHSLNDVLFVSTSSTISGYTGLPVEIELLGEQHLDRFCIFFPYKRVAPSHDTLVRVFYNLDVVDINKCFVSWTVTTSDLCNDRIIALDSKTIRGVESTCSSGSKRHIVSAFNYKNKISARQLFVFKKNNKITAITTKLLNLITINDSIVTIVAMGCRKKIAQKIIDLNSNHILQVEDDQKGLCKEFENTLKTLPIEATHTELDIRHGKIEWHHCDVIPYLELVKQHPYWTKLRSNVCISTEGLNKKSEEKTFYTRYCISSAAPDSKLMNNSVKSHCDLENKLHWTLDVVMKEDRRLTHKGNVSENLNTIKKNTIVFLKQEATNKRSKPYKMQKEHENDKYR